MLTATRRLRAKGLPRETRERLARIRVWLRLCEEVSVWGDDGFTRCHKKTAAKLLRKHAGEIHGRYCDGWKELFLERSPL